MHTVQGSRRALPWKCTKSGTSWRLPKRSTLRALLKIATLLSRPSLAAIKQLEGELGGDLFFRERPHAQLTNLGQKLHPLLKQCYESALGAKSLASCVKSGDNSSLRLALSLTIDLSLIIPYLIEFIPILGISDSRRFPNQLRSDSRWQTEGRLPWDKPLR
jgi:hypothetical protein